MLVVIFVFRFINYIFVRIRYDDFGRGFVILVFFVYLVSAFRVFLCSRFCGGWSLRVGG